jgi:hypothetical protein
MKKYKVTMCSERRVLQSCTYVFEVEAESHLDAFARAPEFGEVVDFEITDEDILHEDFVDDYEDIELIEE